MVFHEIHKNNDFFGDIKSTRWSKQQHERQIVLNNALKLHKLIYFQMVQANELVKRMAINWLRKNIETQNKNILKKVSNGI